MVVSKPLVTFALFAYNQERFVREAVRGALSQAYSPLQIVISDDCSQDGTFEVIQEELRGYDGPHRVVLNRNDRNLGIGRHCNRVMELAEGDLIVASAADDVSLPERTEELVKAWSIGGIFSVYSNYYLIDENGADYIVAGEKGIGRGTAAEYKFPLVESWQQMVRSGSTGVFGCTHAWDRAVFDTFGPLPEDTLHEDVAIPFRSALLGKVAYVDKCLVKYRRHAGTTMVSPGYESQDLQRVLRYHATQARFYGLEYESWLRDLRLFLSTRPEREAEFPGATEIIAARAEFFGFKASVVDRDLADRLRVGSRALASGNSLGVEALLQGCLLSASPAAYYRAQRWYPAVNRLRRDFAALRWKDIWQKSKWSLGALRERKKLGVR